MKEVIMKLMLLAGGLLTTGFVLADNYDFEVDGLYYNVVSLPDMTAEVARVNHSYKHDTLSIPEYVTYMGRAFQIIKIGKNAFYGDYNLISVTIPNSVTEIGGAAFYQCKYLTSVDIPNSITEIGNEAFYQCENLTSVTIPNSVTEIKIGTFDGCSSLTSITIPSNVTSIGGSAFYGCGGLTSIEIPDCVTEIGGRAFGNCRSLTSITIPKNVRSIGSQTFEDCSSLDSIIIQSNTLEYSRSLTDETAFYNCPTISYVRICSSVNTISKGFFSFITWKYKKLREVIIDNSEQVLDLGGNVFRDDSLKTIYYGRNVSNTYSFAESSSNKLREVYIGDNVTDVYSLDLGFYKNLEILTIGKKLSEVPNMSGCSKLTTITLNSETPPTAKGFSNVQYMTSKVYVPKGSLAAYQSADVWKNFWNLQESETTDIDNAIMNTHTAKELKRYDAAGRETDSHHKGLNIIRMSDGTTKKVIVK